MFYYFIRYHMRSLILCGSVEGTVRPALCPFGYYCPQGLTLGLEFPCPPGTVQNQLGAPSAEACLPCPAGMERNSLLFHIIIIYSNYHPPSTHTMKMALFYCCFLQGCSAPSLVFPSPLDSVKQATTVLLDQPAPTQPSIRCCSLLALL